MGQHDSAKEFLRQLSNGEFDGRLYETIANLPTEKFQQIVALAAERQWPSISADAPRTELPPKGGFVL